MGNALKSWPLDLRVACFSFGLAGVVAIVQDVGLASRRSVDAFEIFYAGLVTVAYALGVAFGLLGRRRAFFWNGVALVVLHAVFLVRYAWSLVTIVRVLDIDLSRLLGRYDVWNFGLLVLTAALACYLWAVERPRLFRFGPT